MIGITGPLWFWFRDYLTHRQHYVHFNGASSSLLPVISGVPQGSVPGPLLFLIYVNDIPSIALNSSIYMFADDTKFSKSISQFNDTAQLQSDINSLANWCRQWGLSLNLQKCTCLRFSLNPNCPSPSYTINGVNIALVVDQRDLGVTASHDLSWRTHYSKICLKAYHTLHFIRRSISTSCPIPLKRSLYTSLIRSQLMYCSQLRRPRLIKDIIRIESVQRRSTKFILSYAPINYKDRLIQLQILPLMYMYGIQDILFLVKNFQSPQNLDILKFISFSTTNTRSGTKLKLRQKLTRTSATRHSYFNRVVNLWNLLPAKDIYLPLNSI